MNLTYKTNTQRPLNAWLIVAITMLGACTQKNNDQLVVEGVFTQAAGSKIMLAELPYASPNRMVLDSAVLDSTGKFHLQSVQSQENLYQLFIAGGPGILIINDANHIELQADAIHPERYETIGSPASKSIKSLYEGFMPLYQQWQQSLADAENISRDKKTSDSLRTAVLEKRDAQQKQLNDYLLAYLSSEKNATAQYFALGMAKKFLSQNAWNGQLEKAIVAHPQHPGLALLRVSNAGKMPQGSQLLNKPVPELVLPDTAGKNISLSSFRGRWVLVDCWASWCEPCRKQNPNVVAAYRKYNKRNFTVLGVSLDKDRNAWLNAIAKDTLTWTNVSDLKYWDSKAASLFDIQALPFNMLVDPKGEVKAINLTDSLLELKLKEVLK